MELKNKVALVTGGAIRVGKAIALGLAKEGAKVAIHYHRSKQEAEKTLAEINAMGGSGWLVAGDFSRVADIENVAAACFQKFNRIDILINNAAIYFPTPFGETTERQWDELMKINLKAPFFCAQAVAKIMKQGKIINIADVAGIDPWPGFLPYSISKAGLIALTRGLAKTLAPDIQVNAIAAGTVLLQDNATAEYKKEIEELSLLKKVGSPDDIVSTVLYLLQGSDFLTGAVIPVDGGRLLV
jgi:NAD(P)-dependent dehydrogenase (short-subunit alcohol dehydrogenase family)